MNQLSQYKTGRKRTKVKVITVPPDPDLILQLKDGRVATVAIVINVDDTRPIVFDENSTGPQYRLEAV